MNHASRSTAATLSGERNRTHVSLFDGSNCGPCLKYNRCFSLVQYHPGSSARAARTPLLFARFVELCANRRQTASQFPNVSPVIHRGLTCLPARLPSAPADRGARSLILRTVRRPMPPRVLSPAYPDFLFLDRISSNDL